MTEKELMIGLVELQLDILILAFQASNLTTTPGASICKAADDHIQNAKNGLDTIRTLIHMPE